MDRNHHDAKFSIPVFVLHQSFWKFCAHLYLGFAALHSDHHLPHAVAVHGLHSHVGRNQLPSEFCARFEMFYVVSNGRYSAATALPLSLQKSFTKRMSAHSSFVNVLGILTTALYNNTATQLQPLTETVYKQELNQGTV
jgi:hypothetical protein